MLHLKVHLTRWAHGGTVLARGEHELAAPADSLVRAVAAAHAAGAVEVLAASKPVQKKLDAAVQPDKDARAFKARCDQIRHRLLPDRSAAIRAGVPPADAQAAFEAACDEQIRAELGRKGG